MGFIVCCNARRKAVSYALEPKEGYLSAQLDYLEECPVCGHTVSQLIRIDLDNNPVVSRAVNAKAKKFFERIRGSILYTLGVIKMSRGGYSKFYLNYNEFGKKKKCYSNLSTLKIGLHENGKILNTNRLS